jgi:hypothetical protein
LSRHSFSSLAVLVAVTLGSLPAAAEPKDKEASALAKQAMDGDYLGTEFKEAEQKLQKALKLCGKQGCSAKINAQVHLNLAIVYIARLKKQDKGNKEMQAAIAADPAVQLSADFSTPEIEKAYTAAGGIKEDAAPEPAPRDEDEDEPKPAAPAAEELADNGDAALNWFSASFQLDLLSYKETTGVCTGAEQYQCFLQG